MRPEDKYLDFHTHRLRRSDRSDINEIVSIHPDKTTEHSFYTYGKHPWWTETPLSSEEQEDIVQHLDQPNCLAMGEMGLDKLKGPELPVQEEVLRSQLQLARERQVPVIIHCVRAFDQLLRIKKDFPTINRWCIHGYARNEILAKQLTDQGFYLSLMPMKTDEKYVTLIRSLPLNRFFLETDSMPNVQIEDIYKQVATILEMKTSMLVRQMNQNAWDFFGDKFR